MKRRLLAAQLLALAFALGSLRVIFPSIHAFVLAIDHGDVLFADFANHYYPTITHLRDGAPAGGFFYPAGFAALLAPLALLPANDAFVVWAMIQIACTLWVALVLVREAAGEKRWLAVLGAALVPLSVPVLHNLKWGQVSILILATVGGAFVIHARRPWLAALLLGIAAGIKGYPLVFIGWFVARGDSRFVVRASVAALFTLVVWPAIVMGPEHALFVQRVSSGAALGAADGVLRDFNSQYLTAVLARFHGGWDDAVRVRPYGNAGAVAALLATAVLAAIAARTRAPRIAARRDLFGLVLVAGAVPFFLRTSWAHYFVHLPVAAVLLLATLDRRRDAPAIAIFVAPSMLLASVAGLRLTQGWWYYANEGSLFFANALVLLACAYVIVDAHVRAAVRAS